MNRKELIYELTKYELDWFVDNGKPYDILFYEFFANGGFNVWDDKELQKKYDNFIKEAA